MLTSPSAHVWLRTAAGLGMAALSLLLAGACSGSAPVGPASGGSADTAACPRGSGPSIEGFPDTTLACLTGAGSVDLSVLHHRPEIIVIWASWCWPCRQEARRLQQAHAQLGHKVLFLGVDAKDSRSSAASFLRAQGVTYPQVFDPDGTFPRLLGLQGVPNTLAVDAQGRVVYRHFGELSAADLRDALRSVGVRS